MLNATFTSHKLLYLFYNPTEGLGVVIIKVIVFYFFQVPVDAIIGIATSPTPSFAALKEDTSAPTRRFGPKY